MCGTAAHSSNELGLFLAATAMVTVLTLLILLLHLLRFLWHFVLEPNVTLLFWRAFHRLHCCRLCKT